MNIHSSNLIAPFSSPLVTKFLVESGYLLHFADHLGALDSVYFLDPAWLCDILVHVLIVSNGI